MIVVLAIFLISNRGAVGVQYWPVGPIGSAALGAIVLIAFGAGALIGLLLTLPGRLGAQRRARRAEKRIAALESRLPSTAPAAATTQALSRQR